MAFLSNESVDLIKNTDRKDRLVKRHINDVNRIENWKIYLDSAAGILVKGNG